jgi:hypothetical protein
MGLSSFCVQRLKENASIDLQVPAIFNDSNKSNDSEIEKHKSWKF